MSNLNPKIIKHKLGLLELAKEPGNVSKARKAMGYSRDTFYRYKSAVDEGGANALLSKAVANLIIRNGLACFKDRLKTLEKLVEKDGIILTDAQVKALEKKKVDDLVSGEIETEHPGYLGSQDTFFVATLKGVGRIYQQSFVNTYAKVAFAKLYINKTPIMSANLLNDKVLPFSDEHNIPLLRVLADRGTEYCGRPNQHDYELNLGINDIEHTKTKARSPQTNGICERFHKKILQEFYQVTFRKKIYIDIDDLQKDLDDWLHYYNHIRTYQGKMCCGRTPIQTLEDGKLVCKQKILNDT